MTVQGWKHWEFCQLVPFQDFLICFLFWRHQYPFDPKIQLEIANAFAKQCKPIYVNLSNYNFECWMTVLLAASWGDDYGIKVILICNVQAAEFTQCHSSSSSLELCHHQSNITSSNSFVAYSDHVQWPARTCKVYMSSDFEGRSHTQSHKLSSPVMGHFAHTRHLPLLYIYPTYMKLCLFWNVRPLLNLTQIYTLCHNSHAWCLSLGFLNTPSHSV